MNRGGGGIRIIARTPCENIAVTSKFSKHQKLIFCVFPQKIKAVKQKAVGLLEDKISLKDEHYLGAVLCPNVKNVRHSTDEERNHAISLVLERLEKISLEGEKNKGNVSRYT